MRILLVSQTYFPFMREGGRPTKVRAIAEGLAARGHNVTLLTSQLGPLAVPNESEAFAPIRSRYGQCATLGGVDIVYLRSLLRRRTATFNERLIDFCREELPKADVVHIFGIYDLLGPVAAHFTKRVGSPYLLETMGMFPARGRSKVAKHLYHLALGRSLVRHAQRVIVSSEQERGDVCSRGVPESQVVIRRNGVHVPETAQAGGEFRRAHAIAADARMVLFLGRLVPEKGIETLLRAFARVMLRDQGMNANRRWVLIIAGPCDDPRYLATLANHTAVLGLQHAVRFVGGLYGNAKWSAIRDATFIVQPSIRESFGNSVAEAIACGIPVIATNACGVMSPLLGGETRRAALVVSQEEAELGEAIFHLGTDESLHARLSAACPAAAATLNWKEPLDQLELLYDELHPRRRESRPEGFAPAMSLSKAPAVSPQA